MRLRFGEEHLQRPELQEKGGCKFENLGIFGLLSSDNL